MTPKNSLFFFLLRRATFFVTRTGSRMLVGDSHKHFQARAMAHTFFQNLSIWAHTCSNKKTVLLWRCLHPLPFIYVFFFFFSFLTFRCFRSSPSVWNHRSNVIDSPYPSPPLILYNWRGTTVWWLKILQNKRKLCSHRSPTVALAVSYAFPPIRGWSETEGQGTEMTSHVVFLRS